jgi:ectoine hydroxylase-related dioxygenase (phytanoyl-CoA dioxygenase family)
VITNALTLSQRFHLDAYGYVLLKGVLSQDQVERIKAALYRMRADPELEAKRVYTHKRGEHYQLFGHLVEYDPALLEYAVHPKLVACAEELVGGAVRLEESEAIINRRRPDADLEALRKRRCAPTGFHTGTRHGWGTYYEQNRFHAIFVKTLAYLTDVGPEDGGTAVIPGSHRMSWPQAEMIQAAMEDERLIHQVTAQAGDVLLFPESLIHSTTEILSEKERVIIVSGYTPTMVREWMGNEISSEFIATLPQEIRPILSAEANWRWRRNYSA